MRFVCGILLMLIYAQRTSGTIADLLRLAAVFDKLLMHFYAHFIFSKTEWANIINLF